MVLTRNPSFLAESVKILYSDVEMTEVPQFLGVLTSPWTFERWRPWPSVMEYNNPVVSLKVADESSSNTIGIPKLLLK